MNINLGLQWEEFISGSVQSGRYLSASEVVREGLRLLQEREDLRKQIDTGVGQLDRGEYVELDDHGVKNQIEDVKVRGRERLAKEKTSAR